MGNGIHGTLFIIAAPSGAGKTSLVKELLKKIDNLSVSTSYTTRQSRKKEVDGKDYHFIKEKKFKDVDQLKKQIKTDLLVAKKTK